VATSSGLREPLVTLLGAPFVVCGGETREFLPERRFQLLAYLAYRGEWLTRDALAFIFWPDLDNTRARRNLRWLLHSVREFSEFATIEAERERIRLRLPTDVQRFETAIRERAWLQAVTLYRGDLCVGLDVHGSEPYVKWLTLERGRLAELLRGALTELVESGAAEDVLALSQRLLEQDPLDEYALRARLGALRELGRADEARRVYRAFSVRLMDELGLEPAAETRTLVSRLETLTDVPTPPSEAESSFIGRRGELAQIDALLAQPECRLLTLIGPGGVGKSRLARQVMVASVARPGHFVSLESLSLPEQLPSQIARVLGLLLKASEDAAMRVQVYFQKQRCLLVLDNFEHLIDAADALSRWLASCPLLQIIVTSRERLDLPQEWLFPVEGLARPRAADADREQYDAVQLFVERARAVKHSFDAHAQLSAICDIVDRVEGLPLAIELAAAWVRLLPCADIARDLASSLELLERQDTADSRHRSVRASFDHSWALLTGRERTLFATLSVFRGGFGREALRHVSQASLPAVAQLIDKSLVRVEGTSRFGLHPLLQQVGRERLGASPADEAEVGMRHAEFFAHWLERFADFRQIDQKVALAEMDVDIDNCLGAWDWALEHRRPDLLRSAGLALLNYFEHKGLLREGLACFRRLDERTEAAPEYRGAVGVVERAKGTLLLRLGQYEEAEVCARKSLHHFRLIRDDVGIKSALTLLGLTNWERGRCAQAHPYFVEGLKRARADRDRSGEAAFLHNLSLLSKAAGRYQETEALLLQALDLYRELGDATHRISTLNNLGNLCRALKDPARGRAPLLEALALSEAGGTGLFLPFILVNLALIELELGNLDAAHAYTERALASVRRGADLQIEIGCHATLARVELARGAAGAARAHIRDAALLAREAKHVPLLLEAAVNTASALRLEGLPEAAATILHMVRSHPAAQQPDRDDVDRELGSLDSVLSATALEAARARSSQLVLDDVIAEAIASAHRS
jgi:predicted ATPase/DNA-binding SARP family transcriptional activator